MIKIEGTATIKGQGGASYTVRALARSERTALMRESDFTEARDSTIVAFGELCARAALQEVGGPGAPADKPRRARLAGVVGGLMPVEVIDGIPDDDFGKIVAAAVSGEIAEDDLGN